MKKKLLGILYQNFSHQVIVPLDRISKGQEGDKLNKHTGRRTSRQASRYADRQINDSYYIINKLIMWL